VGSLSVFACSSFSAAEEIPPSDTGDSAVSDAIGSDDRTVQTEAASTNRRRAFVTSTVFTGDLGETPAQWDQNCQSIAQKKGFSGNFIAWLSAANAPPSAGVRLGLAKDDVREWFDSNGDKVATPTAFAFGSVALVLDENGQRVADGENVWTGTAQGGNATIGDCVDWHSAFSQVNGTYGQVNGSGPLWTQTAAEECAASNRLYCFEK
jgi:hypothetical protein